MDTQELKKYSAAEVALLGVFALGLLLSLIVVKARSHIALAEPVALPFGGVAAPLPQGAGWQAVDGWRYERDNSFILLGLLQQGGRPAMTVRWRYALCDELVEPEALLRQRADSAAARLTLLGQTGGALAMHYGRIESPGTGESYLMGVAVLEQARRLELYIAFRDQDTVYAEAVFTALAGGLRVSACPLQTLGAERVGQFYRTQMRTLTDSDAPRESGMLLKDAANRPLGYVVERVFVHQADGDSGDGHLRLTTRLFETAGRRIESDVWLSFADDAFSWSTQTQEAQQGRPRSGQMRGNTAGRIIVQNSEQPKRTLQRTPMMLAEPLTGAFAAGLPEHTTEMIVDVLTDAGAVVPTRIRRIDPADAHVRSEQAARFIRLEYLHADNMFEELVLDAEGALLGRFEQMASRPARLWEAAGIEQLSRIFGAQFEPLGRNAGQDQTTLPAKRETLTMKEKSNPIETATFAAGCFWGVEYFFAAVPGVVKTQVGYTGGTKDNPTYKEVCTGKTGHAEAVRLEFNTGQIGFEQLVRLFFKMHDPTTLNRQGPDVGSQYRSAIFYHSDAQRDTAAAVIEALTAAKTFKRPIVTQLTAAGTFWPAEDYHQQYFKKNPGLTCHIEFCPKMME